MKTCLMTGAAGFVGRHLRPYLTLAGYNLTLVDPALNMGFERFLEINGSNRYNNEWDLVVHLGANIPDISQRMSGGIHRFADIALDLKVCEYVEKYRPGAFLLPSSCTVDTPQDPYAWVNLTREQLLHTLQKRGIYAPVLRPFSGYGYDQADSYPFPALLKRAMRQEYPLTVWGSLDTVRDWIHIDDLCRAFMWAVVERKAPLGTHTDLGTGVPTRFEDLARKMALACKYDPPIEAATDKPTSGTYRVANTELAAQHGFSTSITLEQGIEEAVVALKVSQELRKAA